MTWRQLRLRFWTYAARTVDGRLRRLLRASATAPKPSAFGTVKWPPPRSYPEPPLRPISACKPGSHLPNCDCYWRPLLAEWERAEELESDLQKEINDKR